ncbi:MAG: hypothetical protein WC758_06500 [Candidatus Woesearchaeota archaeon]|jgi:hypothetical protein
MRFNKKASMELGISTVVVLVIAMVIIAGGIAFIRGFFKLGEDKLGGAFNIADFGVQPTSTNPLVLVEGAPTIKSGDSKLVRIAFYNKGSASYNVKVTVGDCSATVVNPTCKLPLSPMMTSASLNVEAGEGKGFETYISTNCETTSNTQQKLLAGNYICILKATTTDAVPVELASSQITLTVTS